MQSFLEKRYIKIIYDNKLKIFPFYIQRAGYKNQLSYQELRIVAL